MLNQPPRYRCPSPPSPRMASPQSKWSSVALSTVALSTVALSTVAVALPAQEWRPNAPSARIPALAFDGNLGRAVMYGGAGTDETWVFTGSVWSHRTTAQTAGPTFAEGSMVFDTARGRLLLFGLGSQGSWSSVAEYDGTNWVQGSSTQAPPARSGAAFAYDAARGCTVMFGGGIDSPRQMLADTWEYGANGWSQRAPLVAPSGRWFHSLVYDATRSRVVLFGGADTLSERNDTWTYDGTTWTQVVTANAPSPRFAFAMSADSARGKVVLFGGSAPLYQSDTWEFDGFNWTQNTTAGGPSPRGESRMVYDPVRARHVLFGGWTLQGTTADTWQYDGTQWTPVANLTPTPRTGTTLVHDPMRGRTVLFGGQPVPSTSGPTVLGDTWQHDADGWHPLTLAVQPTARRGAMATFDLQRQRLVLFGGRNSSQRFRDTWEFDGTAWAAVATANAPSARNGGMLAYDAGRRRVVLFGGEQPAAASDTWEYDGTDWARILTTNAPSPRIFGAMVYAPALGRTVLFGGSTPIALLGDTWEFDGLDWTPIPGQGPSPRQLHTMAYDSVRGQVLVHGGWTNTFPPTVADTWSYGPAGWQQLATFGQLPSLAQASMAYDLGRDRVVLFGGNDPRTWEMRPAAAASWTRHGTGCAGSSLPSLDAGAGSLPTLGSSFSLQLAALPGPTFLMFGFDLVQSSGQPLPITLDASRPQCHLWIGPLAGAGVFLLPSSGMANHSLAIPANPAFAGLAIGAQALALDGTVPAGFALTNGGILRIQ